VDDKKDNEQISCRNVSGIEYPEPADGVYEVREEEDVIEHNTRCNDNWDKDRHDCGVCDFLENIKLFLFRSREGIGPAFENKEDIKSHLLRDLSYIFSTRKIVLDGTSNNTVKQPKKKGQNTDSSSIAME